MFIEVSLRTYQKLKPYLDARELMYRPSASTDENDNAVVQVEFISDVTEDHKKNIMDIISWLSSIPDDFPKRKAIVRNV